MSGSGRAGLTRRGVMGLAAAGLALGGLPAEAASPRRKKATQVAERVVPLAERDDLIGHIEYYVTDGETTLLEVAHHYDIGVPHISALNPGVDAWVPGSGRTLTLPTAHILPDAPHEGLVINRPELRLYYFPGNGPVQTYSIGVGKDGLNTPVGKTWVVRKQVHPTWHPTEASFREKPWLPKAVPPGPDNPMGDYAMYLGWPAYAIHGTNRVYGVGRRVSHGCIRLYPRASRSSSARCRSGPRSRSSTSRSRSAGTRASSTWRSYPRSSRSTTSRSTTSSPTSSRRPTRGR